MPGWRLEILEEIGSTSDAVIARAECCEADRLAILARRQTQARGSRGRHWVEPPRGNLALSVLLRPDATPGFAGEAVFRAALALHDALGPHAGKATLMLKWPNDVMLDGAKLAGILVESAALGDRLAWLAIGFGANLAARPEIEGAPRAACLTDGGAAPVDPVEIAASLLPALDTWLAAPFEAVRARWLEAAHPPGTKLTVEGRPGRFAGLAPDGALLIDTEDGTRAVSTGRVVNAVSDLGPDLGPDPGPRLGPHAEPKLGTAHARSHIPH